MGKDDIEMKFARSVSSILPGGFPKRAVPLKVSSSWPEIIFLKIQTCKELGSENRSGLCSFIEHFIEIKYSLFPQPWMERNVIKKKKKNPTEEENKISNS